MRDRGAGVQLGGNAAEDFFPFWVFVGNRWWSSQSGSKSGVYQPRPRLISRWWWHPAHGKASRHSFLAWGWAVEHGKVTWWEIGEEECQKNPIKTTFRPIITCSSQEGDAKQTWLPTSRFLSSASRVTAKRKKHFGGIFQKNQFCPPLEFFHCRGLMFCLYYDIFIKILKFSYVFEQKKLQEFKWVLRSFWYLYIFFSMTDLIFCKLFC